MLSCDRHSERSEHSRRGCDVAAWAQPDDLGRAPRHRREDQGAVRQRLVAGDAAHGSEATRRRLDGLNVALAGQSSSISAVGASSHAPADAEYRERTSSMLNMRHAPGLRV